MNLEKRKRFVRAANLSDACAAAIYTWAVFSGGLFTVQPTGIQLVTSPIPAWICWTLFVLWPFDVAWIFYRIGRRTGELA